ncbi:MAG: cyanophycinase [Cyanobacteria bacterium NC_groundwater_1444_Ag_S-0.65um_54_12]|nr:cyanophycinase [Cyanobacteria bacterium NC_groundwater_1444_Ag_S-0.65um_54_12]
MQIYQRQSRYFLSRVLLAVALLLGEFAGAGAARDVKQLVAPLVLIGGGPENHQVTAELLSLAGGTAARAVILPVGSSRPAEAGAAWEKYLAAFGVEARALLLPERAATTAIETLRTLAAADLLFFTGGDQRKLAEWLSGTPVQGALLTAWQRGAVLAGTSAGAMIWGSNYLVSGTSRSALTMAFEKNSEGRPGLELRSAWGFLENFLIDTHFSEKQRLGRLLLALAATPAARALGIDEGTAAIFTGSQLRVIGKGSVSLITAPSLLGNNAKQAGLRTPFAAGPFVMQRLISGQSIDLNDQENAKQPVIDREQLAASSSARLNKIMPMTLVGSQLPLSSSGAVVDFIRNAGGTGARLLLLAGDRAARPAEVWRKQLLVLGAGRAVVLIASSLHDQGLAQVLADSSGIFFLEDEAGTLLSALNANQRQLGNLLTSYALRLPLAAAGVGVRLLGAVAIFGSPTRGNKFMLPGLRLAPGAVIYEQFWETAGFEQLLQAVLLTRGGFGIGLGPENIVRLDQGQAIVSGQGQVLSLEGAHIQDFTLPATDSLAPAAVRGLEISVIPPDNAYDFQRQLPRF